MQTPLTLKIETSINQLSLPELTWLIERLSQRIREIVEPIEIYEPITEVEWLYNASRNPAFADLHDPAEDIYTLEDGKPFYDEA